MCHVAIVGTTEFHQMTHVKVLLQVLPPSDGVLTC